MELFSNWVNAWMKLGWCPQELFDLQPVLADASQATPDGRPRHDTFPKLLKLHPHSQLSVLSPAPSQRSGLRRRRPSREGPPCCTMNVV